MEYVSTTIVRPNRTSSRSPHYVGHITVRFSDEEAQRLFDFGGHDRLRRLLSDVAPSVSAAGSRATDVPGFQDIALEVGVRTGLNVDSEDAVEQWGRSMFQEIREILERI